MRALPVNVVEYLNKFSTGNYQVEWNESDGIDNVIIIPAIEEYENIKNLLGSLSCCDPTYFNSTLVLFVINNPDSSGPGIKGDNNKSLQLLKEIISGKPGDEFVEKIILSGLQICVVDASSKGNELEENNSGVGLARKIGMDLALTVYDYTEGGKKILLCLDADCSVSQNYLTSIVNEFNNNNLSAATVNFEHNIMSTGEKSDAIICYELFLRYYVMGLIYAKSDYAYHSIGSTMVCDHLAYIRAGGMNKRKAAEDFYFLEKLSKIYQIDNIISAVVYPSDRKSWRVPFGTGQRVTRFLARSHDEYLLFNPEVFEILKSWLEVFRLEKLITSEQYLKAAIKIHGELYYFLIKNQFEEQWNKILSNAKSSKQLNLQKKLWFDGFKTLKLIHHLRDTSFPQVNMFDALDEMFNKLKFESVIDRLSMEIPSREVQIEYLKLLREFDKKITHKFASLS